MPGRPARWKSASRSSSRASIAVGEMNDEVTTELAWMMGRPVRYGGEFGGLRARSDYVAEIAADALAPMVVEESERSSRFIAREPHGVVLVVAPWNYPYMTAINTVVPALIAGNTVDHQACHADAARRRAHRARLPRGRRAGRRHPERLPRP
jgi:acyl-CoA reductase-like NAD-dependent aldehyde dehydrogenase